MTIEYDPNRNAVLLCCIIKMGKNDIFFIPRGLQLGDRILADLDAPILIGNSLPLFNMPLGTEVHNVELHQAQVVN